MCKRTLKKIEDHLSKIKSPILETLNPPVTEDQFKEWEKEKNLKVPEELRICYSIHNGQTEHKNYQGPIALCHTYDEGKKKFSSSGVTLDPIDQWEVSADGDNLENFSRGITDDEDNDEEGDKKDEAEVQDEDEDREKGKKGKGKGKGKEKKKKEGKKKKDDEDGDGNDGDDNEDDDNEDDDDEEGDEGDGNRITSGWISFAQSQREESSTGFLLGFAPKNKPKTPLSKKLKAKRLKQNEVLNWDYQFQELDECPRGGKFVDWFEELADCITKLKEGHEEEG